MYEKQTHIDGKVLCAEELNHMEEGIVQAVSYTGQDSTEKQKVQARANIGAGDSSVRVSCTQPTDSSVKVWVNPCGTVKSPETYDPITISGIVGLALNAVIGNTAARYDTIEDALAGNSATADGKVLAFTCDDTFNVMLLDDIQADTIINITRGCTLHLNGKKLSFAAGAHLYIQADSEVTINGKVAGSEITKNAVITTPVNEHLIENETNLCIVGGTYSIETECVSNEANVTASALRVLSPVRAVGCAFSVKAKNQYLYAIKSNADVEIDRCSIVATALEGCSYSACIAAYSATTSLIVRKSTLKTVSEAESATVYGIAGNVADGVTPVFEDCTVAAIATGYCSTVHAISLPRAVLTNCHVIADGPSDQLIDGVWQAFGCCAVKVGELTINGGYYWAVREALGGINVARINGGIFAGCQHGGGYLSGSDIKIKDAVFRNVQYTGVAGWNASHYGACYCTDTGPDGVIDFDNCRFESNANYCNSGVVAKINSGASAIVRLSNCSFENINLYDVRVDANCTIYLGENVEYSTTLIGGTLDTTTYADQAFGFETDTTTSDAVLSVKDDRGNWIGIDDCGLQNLS